MTTERRVSENKALRELVDALKEFVSARDALWSLGFFDRIFRFARCIEMLNRYDASRNKVHNAVQAVKKSGGVAKAGGPEVDKDATSRSSQPLVTLEEFDILLGKPAILKNRPQRRISLPS